MKGNYNWRDPFFTSMIMGGRVMNSWSLLLPSFAMAVSPSTPLSVFAMTELYPSYGHWSRSPILWIIQMSIWQSWVLTFTANCIPDMYTWSNYPCWGGKKCHIEFFALNNLLGWSYFLASDIQTALLKMPPRNLCNVFLLPIQICVKMGESTFPRWLGDCHISKNGLISRES